MKLTIRNYWNNKVIKSRTWKDYSVGRVDAVTSKSGNVWLVVRGGYNMKIVGKVKAPACCAYTFDLSE